MPFLSSSQRRWGHTPDGEKALGGPAKVKEWDSATPKKLPEKSAMKKSFLGGAVKTEKPKNPETKPDSKKKPSFFGGKKS